MSELIDAAEMVKIANSSYCGRLAPTPSGLLHLGHFQTFYVAYQRAKKRNGRIFLRIEDLDSERCKPELLGRMFEDLEWMGFICDPLSDGMPFHMQSKDTFVRYELAFDKLYARGCLYPSSLSRRAITAAIAVLSESESRKRKTTEMGGGQDGEAFFPVELREQCPPDIPGGPRSLAGVNWRFRVPEKDSDSGHISFTDGAEGKQTYIAGKDFGDFVVWTKCGKPSYELAVVVDDAAQGVSEVVRGADLLLSTARQLLLYRALDLTPPKFFHCPLARGEDGRRLAKKVKSEAVGQFREEGVTNNQVRERFFQISPEKLQDLIDRDHDE